MPTSFLLKHVGIRYVLAHFCNPNPETMEALAASEIDALLVKVFKADPDKLSLVARMHKVEEKNWFLQVVI